MGPSPGAPLSSDPSREPAGRHPVPRVELVLDRPHQRQSTAPGPTCPSAPAPRAGRGPRRRWPAPAGCPAPARRRAWRPPSPRARASRSPAHERGDRGRVGAGAERHVDHPGGGGTGHQRVEAAGHRGAVDRGQDRGQRGRPEPDPDQRACAACPGVPVRRAGAAPPAGRVRRRLRPGAEQPAQVRGPLADPGRIPLQQHPHLHRVIAAGPARSPPPWARARCPPRRRPSGAPRPARPRPR